LPTRENFCTTFACEVGVATTWVVIATVAFFGVFLAVVDKLVQLGVAYVFKKFGV